MIHILEQSLRSTITGINFIERYGGIVRPIHQKEEGEEEVVVTNIFPVSRYLSVADCFDSGRIRDLVPDDQYYSVSYWEEGRGGSYQEKDGRPGGLFWEIQHNMRFVCWLNLAKLGWTSYTDVDNAQNYLIKAVAGQHGKIKTVGVYKFNLNITRFNPVQRDPRVVFGPYTFREEEWAFNWPYGFFAVDFEIRAELAAGCITEPALGSEINCVQTW